MNENKELVKALEASIELEENGREFYINAAKKTKDKFGKKMFEALSDDEIRHMVAIKEYCATIAKKNATPQLCAVMPPHKNIKERAVFGRHEAEMLKKLAPNTDELRAIEIAMEMENEGYNFYKKTMESVSDPNAKELYKFLLGEEEAHQDLLSSTYEYLKNPAAWFAKEEKPIVEG